MERRGIEWKVGLFLVIGIGLAGLMILRFGKIEQRFRDTYEIVGIFNNSGGIVSGAQVVCSGVPVGRVRQIRLNPEGRRNVHIVLDVYQGTVVHEGAQLEIKQVGFLGDKYVEIIYPEAHDPDAPLLASGSRIEGRDPFDMNTAAVQGQQLLGTVNRLVDSLNLTLESLNETVTSRERLEQFGNTMEDLHGLVGEGRATFAAARETLETAGPRLNETLDALAGLTNDVALVRRDAEALLKDARLLVALVSTNAVQLAGSAGNLVDRLQAVAAGDEAAGGTVARLLNSTDLYDEAVDLLRQWREYGILSKDRLSRRREREREEGWERRSLRLPGSGPEAPGRSGGTNPAAPSTTHAPGETVRGEFDR